MTTVSVRTAEHVGEGHPDKFCDQVADRVLDRVLELARDDERLLRGVRTAIECLAKDNLLLISGEVKLPRKLKGALRPIDLAREVWAKVAYGEDPESLTVVDHIRAQSPDIAQGGGSGVDSGGAGDQGIMVGYATDETDEMMPRDWVLARDLCRRLRDLRLSGELAWLRSDCKSQVSLDADDRVVHVIVAAQHFKRLDGHTVSEDEVRAAILEKVVRPVVGEVDDEEDNVVVNGTGEFVIGGPSGDAGVVGRKIVVDAYGPRVAVGGGAYSGKDPTKVDRSAAYMARHIAKAVVAHRVADAHRCTVQLAFGIGQKRPSMVHAVTDAGKDVSSWVREKFPDLSPRHIIDYLELLRPEGWSYLETAAYGHYGRRRFPWERIAEV